MELCSCGQECNKYYAVIGDVKDIFAVPSGEIGVYHAYYNGDKGNRVFVRDIGHPADKRREYKNGEYICHSCVEKMVSSPYHMLFSRHSIYLFFEQFKFVDQVHV